MTNTQLPTKEQLRGRFAQELGLEHLATNDQEEVITELSKVIMERITMELMLLLPDDEFKHVDALVKEGKDADVKAIIDTHIPNAPEVIEQVIIRAMVEFKALTKTQTNPNHAK